MASSGGVTVVIPGNLHSTPYGPSARARRRLRSVVDGVGAFVVRRRPPVPGIVHAAGGPPAALDALAGPAGLEAHPVPARPGPVDKPSAVAHYQAMAERVARERALAELDSRRRALSERASVSRDLWVVGGPRANGDPRHG
jgi:hypothetical protein